MLDRIEADRPHSQGVFDGKMQHLQLEPFRQAQDLDILPFARLALPGFQQAPERGEGVRQFPTLQGRSLIEGHDPALDQRQVMQRVEHHVTAVIRAGMIGDHLSGATDNDADHEALDPDRAVAICDRHRVVVTAIPHHRCRCDLATLQLTGLEGCAGQILHCRRIGLQPFVDAGLVSAQDIVLPFAALLFQVSVERIPVRKGRDRHHEVAPPVADQPLDRSLVVPLAGTAVAIPDHIMRQHCAEPLGSLPGAVRQDPRHQAAVIVIEDRQGNRPKESKGMHMPIQPGLGGCRRIGPDKTRIALRQIKGEEVRLPLNAANHDRRFTKIRLRMPGRMAERHEHLFARALPGPDAVFDDCVSAIKAALVAQPLKDTLCGVAPLARTRFVLSKPLVDLAGERIQLRAPNRRCPPIPRWLRIGQHLRNTVSANPKIPGNPTPAQPILKMSPTHLQIQFHGENPPALPSNERAKVDDFYAARDNTTTPLPWPSIAPPITLEDGYNIFGNQIIRNLLTGATAANMQYAPTGTPVTDSSGAPVGRSTLWQGDYLVHGGGLDYDPSNVADASNSGANTGAYLDTPAPGGFWITTFGGVVGKEDSPNVIANNSVAGCPLLGSAYWFVRQDVDSFSERNTMHRPDKYPVFTGNRGHGCYNGAVAGLDFADGFPVIGVVPAPTPPIGTNGLSPTEQTPVVVFDGLTMTQIENKAFWYRGAFAAINNGRFSALKNGMTLVGGGGPEANLLGFWGMVRNSSFAGVTNNNVGRYSDCEGYYSTYSGAASDLTATTALPLEQSNEQTKCANLTLNPRVTTVALSQLYGVIRPDFNFQGYMFYDGPARLEGNRFVNFRADPTSAYPYDNASNTYGTQATQHMVTLINAHRMMNYQNAAQLESPLLGGDGHYGAQGDAAFSWLPANKQSVPPTQYAVGNRWENVNFKHQIFTPISNFDPIQDGDKQAVQIDRDATLSGYVVCANAAGDTCITDQNPNHYPISLSNNSYYQTPYTVDEGASRGRNNAISSALMSPHKYATLNVTATTSSGALAPLTITRDLAVPSANPAQTTMNGRGGNSGVVETTVMNNMGYALTSTGGYMNATSVDLMLSYSDAPSGHGFYKPDRDLCRYRRLCCERQEIFDILHTPATELTRRFEVRSACIP